MTVNRIITAKDYCARDRVSTVKERIAKLARDMFRKKGIALKIQFDKLASRPVHARIELGQWCANCDCGGTEFVDPDERIFFCFSCGNNKDSGALRPVIFPEREERLEIERLVLMRPVEERRGLDDMERAHMAIPVIFFDTPDGYSLPLTRTWNPGESIENLMGENEAIEKWRQASIRQDVTEEVPAVPMPGELAGE